MLLQLGSLGSHSDSKQIAGDRHDSKLVLRG